MRRVSFEQTVTEGGVLHFECHAFALEGGNNFRLRCDVRSGMMHPFLPSLRGHQADYWRRPKASDVAG